jgi:hypothetical protein
MLFGQELTETLKNLQTSPWWTLLVAFAGIIGGALGAFAAEFARLKAIKRTLRETTDIVESAKAVVSQRLFIEQEKWKFRKDVFVPILTFFRVAQQELENAYEDARMKIEKDKHERNQQQHELANKIADWRDQGADVTSLEAIGKQFGTLSDSHFKLIVDGAISTGLMKALKKKPKGLDQALASAPMVLSEDSAKSLESCMLQLEFLNIVPLIGGKTEAAIAIMAKLQQTIEREARRALDVAYK